MGPWAIELHPAARGSIAAANIMLMIRRVRIIPPKQNLKKSRAIPQRPKTGSNDDFADFNDSPVYQVGSPSTY
jgi:hypothetical protein